MQVALGLVGRPRVVGASALPKLPVEQEDRIAFVRDHLQSLLDVAGLLLFLDLFRHELLQEDLTSVRHSTCP